MGSDEKSKEAHLKKRKEQWEVKLKEKHDKVSLFATICIIGHSLIFFLFPINHCI